MTSDRAFPRAQGRAYLTLSVPTVKGSLEGTPSYMTFEVTPTQDGDHNLERIMADLRKLVEDNGLVLVNAKT